MRAPDGTSRRARAAAGGFTLLEAIVALVLVAAIATATLSLQLQATDARATASSARAHAQGVQTIFTMLTEQTLDPPELNLSTGRPSWSGEHLGLPYTIDREPVLEPNPLKKAVPRQARDLAETVALYRYTISYAGRETEVLWHQ